MKVKTKLFHIVLIVVWGVTVYANSRQGDFVLDDYTLVKNRKGKKMNRYEIIIYWSKEDGAFIADVPELPGCAADGATYQEALSNVEVIIQEWIDTARELGRSIPEPKGRLMFA